MSLAGFLVCHPLHSSTLPLPRNPQWCNKFVIVNQRLAQNTESFLPLPLSAACAISLPLCLRKMGRVHIPLSSSSSALLVLLLFALSPNDFHHCSAANHPQLNRSHSPLPNCLPVCLLYTEIDREKSPWSSFNAQRRNTPFRPHIKLPLFPGLCCCCVVWPYRVLSSPCTIQSICRNRKQNMTPLTTLKVW